ncbi:ABC transporter permease [Streptomyces sp. NPDC058665]|uniref:ABC transporter permease n=1 Tax=Streptomyces sp. NPDC058665 TaxID=3346586 RepID=UPI00364B6519
MSQDLMSPALAPRRWVIPPLARMILQRLAAAVAVLFVVTILIFAFIHAAPGGPEQAIGGREATPELLEAIREANNLNDPLWQQYVSFLTSLLQGDLGTSYTRREPVSTSIATAAGVTLPLLLATWVLSTVIGGMLGLYTARRQGSRADRAVIGFTVVGASSPVFATGVLLSYVFGVELGWLPTLGAGEGGLDTVTHLILPVLTTTIVLMASTTRFARIRFGQVLEEDQVTFARSRGLSSRYIIRTIVLKNSGVQMITLAGAVLVAMTGGLVVVEQVYGLQGIGTLLITGITMRDIPIVQGVTLVVAVMVVVINLVVDILCFVIDPRLRKGLETPS